MSLTEHAEHSLMKDRSLYGVVQMVRPRRIFMTSMSVHMQSPITSASSKELRLEDTLEVETCSWTRNISLL